MLFRKMLPVLLAIIIVVAMCSAAFPAARICLDPGHGGDDSGTIGADGPGYPNEEHINLLISF